MKVKLNKYELICFVRNLGHFSVLMVTRDTRAECQPLESFKHASVVGLVELIEFYFCQFGI